MTVLNVTRRPVTVNVQGRGLMGFKGDKGDPGNLTGPASSVDENIPIFDGIAGDKLKDSGVKLSDKADTSAVTAGLLLKADITSLETEKKLLMDEIDSLKKSAIENSNAPYLTVSDYGDVALAKNSVGVGTVGVDGVTVTNLVDGDFETDSGGFYDYAARSTEQAHTGIYSAKIIPGTSANSVILDFSAFGWDNGDKIFISYYMYLTDTDNYSFLWQGSNIGWKTDGIVGTWTKYGYIRTYDIDNTNKLVVLYNQTYPAYYDSIMVINLTRCGLVSLTEAQLAKLLPVYFDGKKTFSGVGCLVSKDSAEVEVGRMYFSTTPMYSNATLKDILTYSGGKYYHTHNVDSDGVAIAEPYDTEVETNGQFLALSEGTVTYEPWYPDIAVYTDKFTLTKAITAVKELYKYGTETPITDAVIAGDGLSLTSASLTAGDLAYGVFEFSEPLRPLMTIKSRNDGATIADTANGKVYTFRPVITNGAIASWELTEV